MNYRTILQMGVLAMIVVATFVSSSFAQSLSNAYYVARNGQQSGPHTSQEVSAMVSNGQLLPSTLIWREGMQNWQPAHSVADVASLFEPRAAPMPGSTNTPNGPTEFTEHAIRDQSRGNFPAFHVLVPKGWQVKGELGQLPAYHKLPYFGVFEIKAPDGRKVEIIPFVRFAYADIASNAQPYQAWEGLPFMQYPQSIGRWLQYVAQLDPQQTLSNVQVVSEQVDQQATQQVRQLFASSYQLSGQLNAMYASSGQRASFAAQVKVVKMRAVEDGQQIESTGMYIVSHNTNANSLMGTAGSWAIYNSYAISGPVGSNYENDPQLAAIIRSWRVNPDWDFVISKWYSDKAASMRPRPGIAKANNYTSATASTTESVGDIYFNGWKKREAISDSYNNQANLVNSIHERSTYQMPSGNQVHLPAYYQYGYTDGRGNVVLHNDANYNINTDNRINDRNWRPLQKIR